MTRVTALLLATSLVAGAACYQDDTGGPAGARPSRVLLTDAPFPFDSVQSVNLYIVKIQATKSTDTSGGAGSEPWETIVAPHRAFNLLALQQGLTAVVGEGALPAGRYLAVRMIVNTDSSSIIWSNGTPAQVNWQNFTGTPEMPLYALVESPVDVPQEGADIVLDFDLGRSFLYDFFGTKEFTLQHWLRAVNSAATGAISGTVTSGYTGSSQPIKNANVAVYDQNSFSAYLIATGHTDDQGYYKVAFLLPGTYFVEIQQPNYPFLATVTTFDVVVTAGATATLSVSLPEAGNGGAYIQISGPGSVGVGGTIRLQAAVGDANGNPVANPVVTWMTPDTGLITLADSGLEAGVSGKAPGQARVIAMSNAMSDTAYIQVVGSSGQVATVTLIPASVTIAVGDSVPFIAQLRDSLGTPVENRPVSWFVADTSIARIESSFGTYAHIRAKKAGSTTIQATSDGKVGTASITVN